MMNPTKTLRTRLSSIFNPDGKAILGLIVIAVLFHSSILFQLRLPLDMDSLLFFYPLRILHNDPEVGLWDPYLFCGYPRDANPQSQLLYLPNALSWILPPDLSYIILLTGHYILGSLLLYGLLRSLRLSATSSFVGAFVFLVSTYWRCKMTNLGLLEGISWVPGVLWFYVLSLERRKQVFSILAAMFLAMVILAGVPHTILYTGILLLCLSIGYGFFQKQWKKSLLSFVVTLISAVFLTCGMWLPALMNAPNVIRGSLNLSEALAGALSWNEIGKTFFGGLSQPEISRCDPWEGTCYLGITALLFIPWGWGNTPRQWRYGLSLAFVLALVLTLGEQGFLYPLLFQYLPGWSMMNMPNRSLLLAAMALPVFVAYGFQAWFDKEEFNKKSTLLIFALSIAFLFLFVLAAIRNSWIWNGMLYSAMTRTFYPESITPGSWAWWNFCLWGGLSGLLIVIYQRKWLRAELVFIFLVLFIVVQSIQYSQRLFLQTTERDYYHPPKLVEALQKQMSEEAFFRICSYTPTLDTSHDVRVKWIKPVFMQRLPEVYSLYDIHGYDPTAPASYTELLRTWAGHSPTANPDRMVRSERIPSGMLDLLGVRYIVGNPEIESVFLGRRDDAGPCSLVSRLEEPIEAEKIRIRWLMAGAASVRQGVSVGQVHILNGTQTVQSFPVRAGVEIANYMIDPPEHPANHRPVKAYRWFPIPSKQGYSSVRQYWTSFSFDQPVKMDQVKIDFTLKNARISIFSIDAFRPEVSDFTLVTKGEEFSLYKNENAIPPVYFTRNWSTYDELDEMIQDFERDYSKESIPVFFDPDNTFMAEKSPIDSESTEGNNVDFKRVDSDRYLIHLKAVYDGVLVITENYSPDWVATVNGEKREIMRANHSFMAIPVTRGEHSIEFIYKPLWFYRGILVSSITFLILVFLLTVNKRHLSKPTR